VPSPVAVVARWLAAVLATGFLVFGLAVPLAYAILTVALLDRRAGAPLPSFIDVWALLWRRRLRFITALLPAAALVALGSALFFLPGLVRRSCSCSCRRSCCSSEWRARRRLCAASPWSGRKPCAWSWSHWPSLG